MTIEFNCPSCGAVIAFADPHAGKGARCTTCGQHLIIPNESFSKPLGLAEEEPDRGEPVPGFYRAAFAEGWGLFVRPGNVVPLLFVLAVVCFKFFIAHVDYSFSIAGRFNVYLPVGLLVRATCWGCLFWYYLEIINNTVLSDNTCELPEIEIEGCSEFFVNALRSLWVVAMALVICILPATVAGGLLGKGSSILLSQVLTNVGLFIVPMLFLAVGVNRDSTLLVRIDLMLGPLFKTFVPYLSVALPIMILVQLQFQCKNYGDNAVINADALVKASWLMAQLGLQCLAILGMRGLGLLHRHYQCFFRW